MAIDEGRRHELFDRAVHVLGAEAAETLTELLPPVGWADVATNRDLDQLAERLELRMDLGKQELLATLHVEIGTLRGELHNEIGTLRSEINAQTRTTITAMISIMIALAVVVVGAAHI